MKLAPCLHYKEGFGSQQRYDLKRYIHPTPEGQEGAFERFANLNREAVEKAENGAEWLQFPLQS